MGALLTTLVALLLLAAPVSAEEATLFVAELG